MKSILFLLILIPFFSIAQEPLTFSEVIDVPGVDKNELFIRGREWFNDNFKSSKDVLQITDKETGELSGKGTMEVMYVFKYMGSRKFPADVSFQMNVWVKDGKFKYEMTNFVDLKTSTSIGFGLITTSNETSKSYSGYSEKRMNETYLSIKESAIMRAKLLIEDLKLKMAKNSKATDW